jgi:hypothetical protein
MRRSVIRRATAFVALLAAPSCSGGGGVPFVGTVSRSQFFEYHDRVDEPLCPTLLSMLDQNATQIGGKIGLRPDPSHPTLYFKFADFQDFAASSGCPESGGCSSPDAVYSPHYFSRHELAHTYTFRAWGGHPTGLVIEGEAVALSCDPDYRVQAGYRPRDGLGNPDWRDLIDLFGNSDAGYSAAGYWITYLANQYGWDSVRQLQARVPFGITAEDFEREFARVYPISMDEAWSAALDAPDAMPCQDDWRCMSTPLAVGDHAPPACDGDMHRSITVTDQAGVVLTLGGGYSQLLLRDCTNPASQTYSLFGGPTDRATHFATLPAGTYTLFGAPPDVELTDTLPSNFDSAPCGAAGGVTLDPTRASTIDLFPGRTNGWIPIAGGGQRYLVTPSSFIWDGWPNAAGGPALCDSCDATATCVPLPYNEQTGVTIGDGAVLRLVGISGVASQSDYGEVIIWPASLAGGAP